MKKTARNGEIDLFRFIFSVIILILHFEDNYHFGLFRQGYIGVEFFFLVTGYLMAGHVARRGDAAISSDEIANDTWYFVKRKVSSFYRYYCVAMILWLVVLQVILRHNGLKQFFIFIIRGIPQITLSFMGLCHDYTGLYVGNTWYLSAMMISIVILYPLLLKARTLCSKIVFPLFSMFILNYLYQKNGSICATFEWNGFFYQGLLRSIAEIALGTSIYSLQESLQKPRASAGRHQSEQNQTGENSLVKKLFLSVVKFGSYGLVILYASGKQFGGKWSLHAFLFLMLAVTMSFSSLGYTIKDSRLTRYLGKISLPIFVFHGFLRYVARTITGVVTLPTNTVVLMIIASLAISVLLMYVTDGITVTIKQLLRSEES